MKRQPNTTLSTFHLGWFDPESKPSNSKDFGRYQIYTIPDKGLGKIVDMTLLDPLGLIVLRERSGTLQRFQLHTGDWSSEKAILTRANNNRLNSLCAYEHYVLALEIPAGVMHVIPTDKLGETHVTNSLRPKWNPTGGKENTVFLGNDVLVPRSRIRIAKFLNIDWPIAIIGPTREGTFLAIDLMEEFSAWKIRELAFCEKIPTDSSFCIDAISNTIIVADSKGARILELHINNGDVNVICSSSTIKPKGKPRKLMWRPTDVSVSRLDEKVVSCLAEESIRAYGAGTDETKPRTILFCDGEQPCVRQFIDLSIISREILRIDHKDTYVLIGSGKKQVREVYPIDSDTAQDLTMYGMPFPAQILTIANGDIIIRFEGQNNTLLHIQPGRFPRAKPLLAIYPGTSKNENEVDPSS